MKTHYATVDGYNSEAGYNKEWSEPICGIYSENATNDWYLVDCKKCLKLKERQIQSMKEAMEHSVKDMAGFNEFV